MKTLDSVLDEVGPAAVGAVKMDVEKYECNVLEGGQSLFTRFHPHFVRAETAFSGRECFEKAARDHGYSVFPQGGETTLVANS